MSDGTLTEAVERAGGNFTWTARALKVSTESLKRELLRRGLDDLPLRAINRRHAELRRKTRAALEANDGSQTAAARMLGTTQSTIWSRIVRYGLLDYVDALRPTPLSADKERALLQRLIRQHDGVLRLIAKDFGVSKATLRARLKQHGLDVEAEARRIETNKIGHRSRLGKHYKREERRAKLVALMRAVSWNVPRAAEQLGVSPGTIYNRFIDLGINRHEEKMRDLLPAVIAALEDCNGVVFRAAKLLCVGEHTLRRWVKELQLNFDDYRPSARRPHTRAASR